MTEHRSSKHAVRARMAQTGEKYTQARRALLGDGDGDGDGDGEGAHRMADTADPQPQPLAWFTDQAYNAIVLAQDEARMLGQTQVAPEHLLLAAARSGNVQRLLGGAGVSASDIHATLVASGGFAANLVVGPIPRSRACEAALWQAIRSAHLRGLHGPSSEHLLLGLAGASSALAVLCDVGIVDVVALVDARYPVTRGPLPISVPSRARSTSTRRPPSPGPMPPVFERFTAQARTAIVAAMGSAGRLVHGGYPNVQTAHILLGLLVGDEGVVATVRARYARQLQAAAERGIELLQHRERQAQSRAPERVPRGIAPVEMPPVSSASPWPPIFTGPVHLIVGSGRPGVPMSSATFSPAARRLLAEDVLAVAHRLGHVQMGTGHLLLAVLDSTDETVDAIRQALPDAAQIAAELTDALPGDERA